MNTLREAAEMALAVLKDINKLSLSPGGIALPAEIDTAMDLLRAALASQTVPSDYPDSHQRKPLTDDEIGKIAVNSQDGISPHDDTLRFARAIERAHGIGSEE
jgi:hypothetical protein